MKKLMMAAAIVCAAALAQASTVTWACTKVYAEGTQTGVSGLYYVMNGTTYTSAALITALEGVGATAAKEYLDGISASISKSGSGGAFSYTTKDTNATSVGLKADGTEQALTILVFDSADITDSSKFFVATKTGVAVPESGNALFNFGAQGNTSLTGASQVAGAWHAVNVPEPTSGLLLLLCVAGMALRRRRA